MTTVKAYILIHRVSGTPWRSKMGALAVFDTFRGAEDFRDGGTDTRGCQIVAVNVVDDSQEGKATND